MPTSCVVDSDTRVAGATDGSARSRYRSSAIHGNQRAEIAREADRDRRDRAGLDDQEQRPAVQETPERRERLAEIDVLAAGARHHRRQLAVRQRADDRQQRR